MKATGRRANIYSKMAAYVRVAFPGEDPYYEEIDRREAKKTYYKHRRANVAQHVVSDMTESDAQSSADLIEEHISTTPSNIYVPQVIRYNTPELLSQSHAKRQAIKFPTLTSKPLEVDEFLASVSMPESAMDHYTHNLPCLA